MKVAAALSGGVDSAVAAALLQRQGYEVIGITMQLRPFDSNTTAAVTDAREVARQLGIEHHVVDLSEAFSRQVIDYFCREYAQGRTPNPCIKCNRFIKFGALWEKACELGAELAATGHYARIEQNNGRWLLQKGKDNKKDQSYVLYTLKQEQLRRTLFPLGHLTKIQVREIARKMKLPVAGKSESQEICFVPDNDYAGFLAHHVPQAVRPGPIISTSGEVLGEHQGIAKYTIGQRKGLRLAVPEPLYITSIDAMKNTVTVGSKEQVYQDELTAAEVNWIAFDKLVKPLPVHAKIRYLHPEAEATIIPLEDKTVKVKFQEPQMAITPGQAVVFYDGEIVVGGGTIKKAGN